MFEWCERVTGEDEWNASGMCGILRKCIRVRPSAASDVSRRGVDGRSDITRKLVFASEVLRRSAACWSVWRVSMCPFISLSVCVCASFRLRVKSCAPMPP